MGVNPGALKFWRAAGPSFWASQALRLGCHMQAWSYTNGFMEATKSKLVENAPDFVFAVVEKTPPHEVILYRPSQPVMAAGEVD